MPTLLTSPPVSAVKSEATKKPGTVKRIPSLDGLRAVSILLVLLAHVTKTSFPQSALSERFADVGVLGVQIFFVISGFLITLLLVREKELAGTISLKRFYVRRAFRILPVFYAYLGCLLVLELLGLISVPRLDKTTAFLYVSNFVPNPSWWTGHFWSLSVEEQFYLLWPLAVQRWSRRTCTRLVLAVAIVVPVVRTLVYLHDPAGHSVAFLVAPQFADVLAIGCLCGLMLPAIKNSEGAIELLRSPVWFSAPLIMVAFNMLRLRPDRCPVWIALPWGQLLTAVLAAAIILRVTLITNDWAARTLNWPPVAGLGVLSYSIYVWQQLFLNPGSHYIWNIYPWNILAALSAAMVSYLVLERSFLTLRKRFSQVTD